MNAAVLTAPRQIDMQQLPDPVPAANEVLVRVTACGVCGSDVHIVHGQLTQSVVPPIVIGHEIAGIVHAIGSAVTNVSPGDNVCVDPVIACGCCPYCRTARPNLCPDMRTLGYARNGGFAQYTVAPATNIYRLNPDTPPAAGLLVETLACVLNGYDKLDLKPGCTALVIGAGTVGLLWTSLLASSPVAELIVAEPVDFRRRRAAELHADTLIAPDRDDFVEAVLAIQPDGVDLVIDASGDPAAIEAGITLVRKYGTFIIFGIAPPTATITVSPHQLYQKEMRIIASKMPPYSLQRAAQMIDADMINHDLIVTDTLPLDKLSHAIDLFESARDQHIKIAIDPWL